MPIWSGNDYWDEKDGKWKTDRRLQNNTPRKSNLLSLVIVIGGGIVAAYTGYLVISGQGDATTVLVLVVNIAVVFYNVSVMRK